MLSEFSCSVMGADVTAGVIMATIPQSYFKRVTGAGVGVVKVKAHMQ